MPITILCCSCESKSTMHSLVEVWETSFVMSVKLLCAIQVICVDGRLRGLPDYQQPSLSELRDTALTLAKVGNPNCKVVGISVNTQHLFEDEAVEYLAKLEAEMGLPAVDPFRHGAGRLVDALAAI